MPFSDPVEQALALNAGHERISRSWLRHLILSKTQRERILRRVMYTPTTYPYKPFNSQRMKESLKTSRIVRSKAMRRQSRYYLRLKRSTRNVDLICTFYHLL